MSLIQIENLNYCYDNSYLPVFKNLSLQFDTQHKTALIGRNARGKTTLLKILANQLDYTGTITKQCSCHYFPYQVNNPQDYTLDICNQIIPSIEQWQLEKELRKLQMIPDDIFYRPFSTLSHGEQTKILLALLFLKADGYLLIDEPTNHLDQYSREIVAKYLKQQVGFLLVCHDREFIDLCCDHIIALNPQSIDVVSGNFSSWYRDKRNEDQRQIEQNTKIKKEVKRLEKARLRTENWSYQVEKSKKGAADKGYVGHMAAKMMKKSKNIEKRQNKAIQEKKNLLQDIEEYDDLSMHPLNDISSPMIRISHLHLQIGNKTFIPNLTLDICSHDRILLKGKNGCGKSSLIKAIIGGHSQIIKKAHLKIAYMPQEANLCGSLDQLIAEYSVDETLVKTILRKLGLSRDDLNFALENMSEGQKKKVMLAITIATPAHLYILDEPLNFLDIFARIQLENMIIKDMPTLIFVEHDTYFQNKIATKIIDFDNNVNYHL